ncbi:MAG: MIP family channel protein [Acidobacteriota bacterium]|nr:MAG: MIP family channel protein [Acidobacteriota bacterium]
MHRDTLFRELLAEFLGTFILLAFGAGVVAQVVLSGEKNGTYLSINLAWGFAVTMGIYVAGGVTGAHLNPAVTLALAARRGFSKGKVLPYWVAQTAGAFTASAAVWFIYREAFNAFDGGTRAVLGEKGTAGIFSTYPQPYLSTFGGLVDQIAGTALLMLVISAIGDARNNSTGNLGPLAVGFLVTVIGMSFGFNAGYAINPARDLGPRLFTFIGGWGSEVFTAGNYWFWVPIAGPLIGGPLGTWIYDLFIGDRFPKTED